MQQQQQQKREGRRWVKFQKLNGGEYGRCLKASMAWGDVPPRNGQRFVTQCGKTRAYYVFESFDAFVDWTIGTPADRQFMSGVVLSEIGPRTASFDLEISGECVFKENMTSAVFRRRVVCALIMFYKAAIIKMGCGIDEKSGTISIHNVQAFDASNTRAQKFSMHVHFPDEIWDSSMSWRLLLQTLREVVDMGCQHNNSDALLLKLLMDWSVVSSLRLGFQYKYDPVAKRAIRKLRFLDSQCRIMTEPSDPAIRRQRLLYSSIAYSPDYYRSSSGGAPPIIVRAPTLAIPQLAEQMTRLIRIQSAPPDAPPGVHVIGPRELSITECELLANTDPVLYAAGDVMGPGTVAAGLAERVRTGVPFSSGISNFMNLKVSTIIANTVLQRITSVPRFESWPTPTIDSAVYVPDLEQQPYYKIRGYLGSFTVSDTDGSKIKWPCPCKSLRQKPLPKRAEHGSTNRTAFTIRVDNDEARNRFAKTMGPVKGVSDPISITVCFYCTSSKCATESYETPGREQPRRCKSTTWFRCIAERSLLLPPQ